MKKLLVALALVAAVALAKPAPADAHVSLSIGLPGFGLFLGAPAPVAVWTRSGATAFHVGIPAETLADLLERLEWFGREVIAPTA